MYPLGGISPDLFLTEYWQQKPLLIRQGFPMFKSPLSPDELAGLACEPGTYSRIVSQLSENWKLAEGPFDETVFKDLPKSHWTLLVQEVDQWIEEVEQLKQCFRFLPSWRMDDVMVSYAPKDGGVGAHIDQYDVFLMQGHGMRKWEIEEVPRQNPELIQDVPISLLKEFNPTQEWILETGDILYLPPGIAHRGTSLSESMTFSFGFRAPSWTEIWESLCLEKTINGNESDRYRDQIKAPTKTPQLISTDSIKLLKEKLIDHINRDDKDLILAFGKLVTEPKRANPPCEPQVRPVAKGVPRFTPGTRVSYFVGESEVFLFVNGESWCFDKQSVKLIESLCKIPAPLEVLLKYAKGDFKKCLEDLMDKGVIEFWDASQ